MPHNPQVYKCFGRMGKISTVTALLDFYQYVGDNFFFLVCPTMDPDEVETLGKEMS